MGEVEHLQVQLRNSLDRVERWYSDGLELGIDSDQAQKEEFLHAARTIRQLRTRATSSMINIALLGGFSSGKSFLVGGLQRRLEYAPITDEDGNTSEQYVGILPSASKATTACPASVVPVEPESGIDASGRGFLRARFADQARWTDIGASVMPAVVAGYCTSDPIAIARGRRSEDRDRTVAEVEVLLSGALLPAKFYDLPGHGSPNPIHDEIAANAWAEADCFMFVTQATATLSRVDLELIGRLYKHHVASGKPVIWVMTGIDRASSVNLYGAPEWKDSLTANNEYMTENFPPSPGAHDTFFGAKGFTPVSPAWEAKGCWRLAEGESNGERLVSMSRMSQLRAQIRELVDAGVGRRHLRTVAIEAHAIVSPRHRLLVEILDSARLPIERLSSERADLAQRLRDLKDAIEQTGEALEGALRRHVRQVERTFRGLEDYLHEELDPTIRSTDLTKEKEANRVEVRKTQLLQEWAEKRGPIETWDREFDEFKHGAVVRLGNLLRDSGLSKEDVEGGTRINVEELSVPPSRKYRRGGQDAVQRISAVVSLSTPAAAGIAVAVGLIGGPVLVAPGAITLAAGVIYASIRQKKSRSTALSVLREEWIEGLNEAGEGYRQAFLAAARTCGSGTIDRVIELMSERCDELSRKILLVETRLAEPENTDRSELVERLAPYCDDAERLVNELSEMSK